MALAEADVLRSELSRCDPVPVLRPRALQALRQTDDSGRGLTSLGTPDEEPVFASECEWANGVLGRVAISLQAAVFEISIQCFPLIQGIGGSNRPTRADTPELKAAHTPSVPVRWVAPRGSVRGENRGVSRRADAVPLAGMEAPAPELRLAAGPGRGVRYWPGMSISASRRRASSLNSSSDIC